MLNWVLTVHCGYLGLYKWYNWWFIWLSAFGHFDVITSAELWKLGVVIAAEYIGVGLGTAALWLLWHVRVILFILQHSLHFYKPFSFANKVLGILSGYVVGAVGYYQYFWFVYFSDSRHALFILGSTLKQENNKTSSV